jgi:hypothetical protein
LVLDDPILTLEKELVTAARRCARRRPRIRAGALISAAAALMAVVIAAGALVLLSGRSHPTPPTAAPSTRQQLTEVLGVLRRPQTRGDLVAFKRADIVKAPGLALFGGTVSIESARLVGVTPWGSHVVVGMANPAPVTVQQALQHRFPKLPLRLRTSGGLAVLSQNGVACCETAAQVLAGGVMSLEVAPGSTHMRIYTLVPDGVARVAFHYPAWSVRGLGPRYRRGETVTVNVRGNMAAAQLRHPCCLQPLIVWYGANGSVLKRVGDLSAARRVAQPSRAALAAAAKANPATPNPVTVSPSAAGSQTRFTVSFKVLIGGAAYDYRLAGPPGCGVSQTGVFGGDATPGHRLSVPLTPGPARHWCPGSYTISVSVARALTAAHALGAGARPVGGAHAARIPAPFGSATFRVRGR